MKKIWLLALIIFGLMAGCRQPETPETMDISKDWRFSPDTANAGITEEWYSTAFDDSGWDILEAGKRWEEQGYPELDGYAWYRKTVEIPSSWKGRDVWIKFGGVNDAYRLFVNGSEVSSFGHANISFAGRPSITKVTDQLKFGEKNLLVVRVEDWGNSGGLWRLPAMITTDKKETELYKPLSEVKFDPAKDGYRLVWDDEFNEDGLDTTKWAVRGIGPRGVGYVSPDAVEVKDGTLRLKAFMENDSLKVGAVGTQGRFETAFGYFECRAKLQRSTGNWAAFWIQSPEISSGEDPAKFGTEIDIFEYFRSQGGDVVSHNLHWAYGPHQKSTGPFLSKVEGIGDGFHTFAVEWTPDKYAFFVDGYKYHEVKQAVSHINEYIILSMEPAHLWDDLKEAVLPDVYEVDYVRVYKK